MHFDSQTVEGWDTHIMIADRGDLTTPAYSGYHSFPLTTENGNFPNMREDTLASRYPSASADNPPPENEAQTLLRVIAMLSERLPPGWGLRVAEEETDTADRRIDAIAELTSPGNETVVLAFEAKFTAVTRDLPTVLGQLQSGLAQIHRPAVPVIVARYLSPSARQWLEERGVSYADATGNIRVTVEKPAMFLRDAGAQHDPWRGPGRPRGTLKGPPAARVVRALIDYAPPVSVTQLVRRSAASTGATYRVVEFLEREGLIRRAPRGPIMQTDWLRLLERWSRDYGFQQSNAVNGYLHPRGLESVLHGLVGSHDLQYAITGSLSAQRFAPYAPARLAMIYAHDPKRVASQIGLRPVDTGANVLLAVTDYHVVYERLTETAGLKYTAPGQTVVDLLTAPGRGPSEGLALMEWMEKHERDWRL